MSSTQNLISMLTGLLGKNPAGSSATPTGEGAGGFAALVQSLLGGTSGTGTETTTSFGTNSSTLTRASDGHMTVRLGGNDFSLAMPGLEDIEALLAQWSAAPIPATASDAAALLSATGEAETTVDAEGLAALLDAIEAALAETGAPPPEAVDSFAVNIDAFIQQLDTILTRPATGLPQDAPAAETEPALAEARALGTRLAELADRLTDALGPMATDLIARIDAAAAALQSAGFSRTQLAQLGFTLGEDPPSSFAVDLETLLAGANTDTADALPPASPRPQLAVPEDLRVSPEPRPPVGDRPASDATALRDNSGPPPALMAADPAAASDPMLQQAGADPTAATVQQLNLARTEAGAVPRLAQAAYQAQAPQLNMPVLAGEIVRNVEAGMSRFQIRLDPPELGRIDVRMDMADNGSVHTRLTVEKAETLDLLQRDQRALERALAQAGLDAGKSTLEFSLRQNPFGQQHEGGGREPRFGGGSGDTTTATADQQIGSALTHYRLTTSPGGVNIIA